jgi:monoamine oxidase
MSYLQFNPHNQGPLQESAAKQTITQQGSIKRSFSDWIIENYGADYLETLSKQRSERGAERFNNGVASDQPLVGIIGGGFAGMYAGLILQSLGIESQIFEGSERVGGRIDTWYSSNYDAANEQTAGLYGEMGGMRLPQYSQDMLPVQHLALAINAVLKSNDMNDKLVEWRKFYYNSPVQRMRYNNMPDPIEAQDSSLNSLNFGTDEGGDIPMVWLTTTTQGSPTSTEYLPINVILDKVNDEFIKALDKSFAAGFALLMPFDNYSMWAYLTNVFTLGELGEYYQESMGPKDANLSYNVTSYLETMNVGTGMYSVSFVEMVIAVYDWGGSTNSYDPTDPNIYMLTVDKGMQNFPDACQAVLNLESGVTADVGYAAQQQIGMIKGTNDQKGYSPDNLTAAAQPPASVPKAESISSNPPPASLAKQRVFMNHQVLGAVHDSSLYDGLGGMTVSVKNNDDQGEVDEKQFPYVISTLPNGKYLNGQTNVDFFQDLSFSKARALREANYMPSFKAFITFDSQFWAILGERQDAGLGVGTSDRSNRQIVYPSYGYDADAGVLQVYCWAQDAERLGVLTDQEAINECLKGIQYLYPEVDVMAEYAGYDPDVTTKTWFWDNHSGGGAFAMFNPGQFKHLYTTLLTPEFDGCLNFAGECCSVHHGWIVGALDSAYNAVYNIIRQSGDDALLDQMERTWGVLTAPDIDSRSTRVQKMLA